MVHTGRAFGLWIVTSVDDWKTFAKDETRTYTGFLIEVDIKSCLGLGLGLPLERTPLLFSREGKMRIIDGDSRS